MSFRGSNALSHTYVFPRPSAAKDHHPTITPPLASTHTNIPPIRIIRGSKSPPCLPPFFRVFRVLPWFKCPQPPACFPRLSASFRGKRPSPNHHSTARLNTHQHPTHSCHSWFKIPTMFPCILPCFPCPSVVQMPSATRMFSASFRVLPRQKTTTQPSPNHHPTARPCTPGPPSTSSVTLIQHLSVRWEPLLTRGHITSLPGDTSRALTTVHGHPSYFPSVAGLRCSCNVFSRSRRS